MSVCSRLSDFGGKRESKTHGKSWWSWKVSSRSIFRVCAFSVQRTRLSQSLEQAMILCVCVSDPIKCLIPFLCYRSKFSVDGLIASSLHNWLSFDQVKSCQWTRLASSIDFQKCSQDHAQPLCCFHFMCIPCRQIQYLFINWMPLVWRAFWWWQDQPLTSQKGQYDSRLGFVFSKNTT